MQISQLLKPSMIKVGLESRSKDELLEEMIDMFVAEGIVKDRQAAVVALLEREAKMSTGIAAGFALPHGTVAGIHGEALALGISRNGLDFESLDDEPVYVVIMLLSEPGNPVPHVEALSEISRLLLIPGFLGRVRTAQDAEQVLSVIRSEE